MQGLEIRENPADFKLIILSKDGLSQIVEGNKATCVYVLYFDGFQGRETIVNIAQMSSGSNVMPGGIILGGCERQERRTNRFGSEKQIAFIERKGPTDE